VAERAKVAGAVERMQARLHKGRSVAEVMQVGGGKQHISIVGRQDCSHPLRLPGDPLHVVPAIPERRQEFPGVARCPFAGRHVGTIAC
jgi:hypothetical protein